MKKQKKEAIVLEHLCNGRLNHRLCGTGDHQVERSVRASIVWRLATNESRSRQQQISRQDPAKIWKQKNADESEPYSDL
jgi:hypothetical protein